MTLQEQAACTQALIRWYTAHWRPLPWREEPTPYRVWVSEIMLQQTRVEAVRPYFERFMDAFPTVEALAQAEEDRLMKLWEGLGYYSRARNLQKAARQIMALHGGALPASYEQLLALPGIGEYTAGAVASIAFGLPVPAVDGNVLRVLARLFDCHDDIMRPAVRRELGKLAAALLPEEQPGAFNQAIMELGETVCLPNTAPACERCPLQEWCTALARGTARALPVRSPQKARRIELRTVLVLLAVNPSDGQRCVLLHRRPGTGLLAGLWELPNVEGHCTEEEVVLRAGQWGMTPDTVFPLEEGRHIFSHIEWQLCGYVLPVPYAPPPVDCRWVTVSQLREDTALPTAFRTYSRHLPKLLTEERHKSRDAGR